MLKTTIYDNGDKYEIIVVDSDKPLWHEGNTVVQMPPDYLVTACNANLTDET